MDGVRMVTWMRERDDGIHLLFPIRQITLVGGTTIIRIHHIMASVLQNSRHMFTTVVTHRDKT